MKRSILKLNSLLLGLLLATGMAACNNKGSENAAEDEPVTDGVAEPIPTPVGELDGEESVGQAGALLKEYFDVKNALVEDDFEKGKAEADDLPDLFKSIEERTLLEKEPLTEQEFNELQQISNQLAEANDLETLRAEFADLSNKLYDLAKEDKLTNQTLYWQHCPMAFNDQGGNWLSLEEEIQNPYMGQSMPKCGTVQETLSN